jgi:phage terminase large subunit
METKLEIPEKAFFLITDKSRYKVIYGGRGSAKSWSAARALIILCLQKNLRILCTRELQTSIKDSVHKLLKDQISALNLEKYFYITKDTIKSVNGSEFLFKGVRNNVSEIKSLEGIDICWIEEAAKMSVESWETLTPTIRKPSSEIWIIFNPDNVDDIIYKKFVIETPDNAKVEKMNFKDNPWFPESLRSEMEYDKKFNYELYDHKWLGNPKLANDAQIFKNKYEVTEFTTPDIKELYQSRFFYGADWGFAEDPTVLIRCFIQDRVLYIDHEAYGVGIEILELPQLFELVPGSKEGVIYGDSARPDIISFLRSKDYNINPAAKGDGSVKAGIDYIKDFEKVVIHPRCKKTIDEFKLYSFKIDRNSGEILPMVVDKYNHCIDSLRYSLSEYIKRKNDIKVFSF